MYIERERCTYTYIHIYTYTHITIYHTLYLKRTRKRDPGRVGRILMGGGGFLNGGGPDQALVHTNAHAKVLMLHSYPQLQRATTLRCSLQVLMLCLRRALRRSTCGGPPAVRATAPPCGELGQISIGDPRTRSLRSD